MRCRNLRICRRSSFRHSDHKPLIAGQILVNHRVVQAQSKAPRNYFFRNWKPLTTLGNVKQTLRDRSCAMSQNYVKVARVKVVNNFGKFYDIINKNLNDKPTKSLGCFCLFTKNLVTAVLDRERKVQRSLYKRVGRTFLKKSLKEFKLKYSESSRFQNFRKCCFVVQCAKKCCSNSMKAFCSFHLNFRESFKLFLLDYYNNRNRSSMFLKNFKNPSEFIRK